MKTFCITIVAAGFGMAALAGDSQISLDEVLREVRARNPAILAARVNSAAMRERVPQAAAWEDPRAELTTTLQRFPKVPAEAFTDQQVTLEQTFPLSGKNRAFARGASAQAAASLQDACRVELDALHRATIAFFKIANAHAKLELNERIGSTLKELADSVRAKYEVGRQTQSDALAAEVALAKNAEARVAIEAQLSQAEAELNALRNRSAFASIACPVASTLALPRIPSAQKALAMALAHRPEIQIARAKLDAATARAQAAHRAWVPDPALRVSAMRYNDTGRAVSEVAAGVAFNLPWFNAGKYSAAIREAENLLASSRHELDAAQTETAQLVRDHLTKIQSFTHHYELYRDNILPLAQQTVRAAQSAYEADKSSFSALAGAQRDAQATESEMLDHLLDAQMAAAEFAAMSGADSAAFFPK